MLAGGYLARLDALRVWPGILRCWATTLGDGACPQGVTWPARTRFCARAGILCLEGEAGGGALRYGYGSGGAALWAGAGVRRRYWGDGRATRMEVAAYLR